MSIQQVVEVPIIRGEPLSPAQALSATQPFKVECAGWRTETFDLNIMTVLSAKRGNTVAQNSIVERYKEESGTDANVRINWSSLTLSPVKSKKKPKNKRRKKEPK